MMNLVVWFDAQRLPDRDEWVSIAHNRGIPLTFPETFDPHAYPVCEAAQVNHPDGVFMLGLGDATCWFQLDYYEKSAEDAAPYEILKGCDRSFAFRWHETNLPSSVAAHLMASTLALAADGVVFWQRADAGFCRGSDAFNVLSREAYRELKGSARGGYSKDNPFGPAVEVTAVTSKRGRQVVCPRCERTFGIDKIDIFNPDTPSFRVYDGEKHLLCGQMIVAKDADG